MLDKLLSLCYNFWCREGRKGMNKSVYSLVLSDEVVSAIDAAAYAAGTNRSAFINSVLAEYVRYVTPERRLASVLSSLERYFTETGFRLVAPASGRMINVGTALSYKYNPAVRYTVEFFKNTSPLQGRLRVGLRTTNAMLIEAMEAFFGIWAGCEQALGVESTYSVEQGKLSRALDFSDCDGDISVIISDYVTAFDKALKSYFSSMESPAAAQSVKAICADYYSKASKII